MGITETNDFYTKPLAFGVSIFGRSYDEKTLIEIASGYAAVSGGTTRVPTTLTPALEDKDLTSYLTSLIEEISVLNESDYTSESWKSLSEALTDAKEVNTKDVSTTYDITLALASAYDSLVVKVPPTEATTEVSTKAPSEIPTDAPTGVSITSPTDNAKSSVIKTSKSSTSDAASSVNNNSYYTTDSNGKIATGDAGFSTIILLSFIALAAGATIVSYKKKKY